MGGGREKFLEAGRSRRRQTYRYESVSRGVAQSGRCDTTSPLHVRRLCHPVVRDRGDKIDSHLPQRVAHA